MKANKIKRILAVSCITMAVFFTGCSSQNVSVESGEISIGKDVGSEDSSAQNKGDGEVFKTQKTQSEEDSTDVTIDIPEEKFKEPDETVQDDPQEEEKTTGDTKEVDLIFFMGQSNMSGCGGDAAKAPSVIPGAGYEYRAVSDPFSIHEIREPFGFSEFVIGGICDTFDGKKGSMVSSFINEYYEQTGHTVVAVSASAGATTTQDWLSQGFVTDLSLRVKNAHDYLNNNGYTVNNRYVVWLQGESDALERVNGDTYETNMDNIIRPLFIEGFTKVFIITPGRTKSNRNFFNEIIDAQLDMCKKSDYYALASTMLSNISTDYMVDEWHYNQDVLNLLGRETAQSVAYYTNEGREMCIYDYKHDETFIPDSNDYSGDETVEPTDFNGILSQQ